MRTDTGVAEVGQRDRCALEQQIARAADIVTVSRVARLRHDDPSLNLRHPFYIGTLWHMWHTQCVPSGFAVESAVFLTESRLEVRTTHFGEALEPTDYGDCLSLDAWTVVGAGLLSVESSTPNEAETDVFYLQFDKQIKNTEAVTVALASEARAANGQPTNTEALEIYGSVVATVAGISSTEKAGDLAFPLAGARGDLDVQARRAALEQRLLRLVTTARGAYAHAEDFGRGVQPKRTYKRADIDAELAQLLTLIRADRDVKAASGSYRIVTQGVLVDLYVVPSFSEPVPLEMHGIVLGGST